MGLGLKVCWFDSLNKHVRKEHKFHLSLRSLHLVPLSTAPKPQLLFACCSVFMVLTARRMVTAPHDLFSSIFCCFCTSFFRVCYRSCAHFGPCLLRHYACVQSRNPPHPSLSPGLHLSQMQCHWAGQTENSFSVQHSLLAANNNHYCAIFK